MKRRTLHWLLLAAATVAAGLSLGQLSVVVHGQIAVRNQGFVRRSSTDGR